MKPSAALDRHRPAVRAAARRRKVSNPRVFGATARGTDTSASDLDVLVDPLPNATLFDLGGFQDEMEELLGVPVDVRTPGDLPTSIRARVLSEAKPASARQGCRTTSATCLPPPERPTASSMASTGRRSWRTGAPSKPSP